MSEVETFRVVLCGGYADGIEPARAQERFAVLCRCDAKQVVQLLTQVPVVVKSGLQMHDANRYVAAINRTGLNCQIEADIPDGETLKCCPKCGSLQAADQIDCSACGIVFHKYQPPLMSDQDNEPIYPHEEETNYAHRAIPAEGWRALGIGMLAAIVVLLLPFVSYVFGAFSTLVHEFGYVIFAWGFAYPSIPAFDFVYGGGVAIHYEREKVLLWVIYGMFGWLLIRYRQRTATLLVLLGALSIYTLMSSTSAHQVQGLFMGHGTELVFSVLFLFRAMSGHSTFHELERVLYGFVGFFLQFRALQFSYEYFTDSSFRYIYEQGKGGMTNDFHRIAGMLHVDVTTVFGFFFLCSLLPPLISWLTYRYETYWFPLLMRLFSQQSMQGD